MKDERERELTLDVGELSKQENEKERISKGRTRGELSSKSSSASIIWIN